MDIEFNYRVDSSGASKGVRPIINTTANINFLKSLVPSKNPFPSFKKTTKVSLEAVKDKNNADEFIKVNSCLSQMSSIQKDVYVLKTFKNVSTREICNDLKISEYDFWKYISAARKEITNALYTS